MTLHGLKNKYLALALVFVFNFSIYMKTMICYLGFYDIFLESKVFI